jgi:hypothetical protein
MVAEVIGQSEGLIVDKDAEVARVRATVAAAARLMEAEQKTAEKMIGANEATAADEVTQSKQSGSICGTSRERGRS